MIVTLLSCGHYADGQRHYTAWRVPCAAVVEVADLAMTEPPADEPGCVWCGG